MRRMGPFAFAPRFLNLRQEAREGYDVLLQTQATQLYLQFKLSDKMVWNSALEAQSGEMHVPYYRMYVRPSRLSKQHESLLNLERRGRRVEYVVPAFYTSEEFDDYYLSHGVIDHSRRIPPSHIGTLIGDGTHYVAFQDDDPNKPIHIHSKDSRKFRVPSWEKLMSELKANARTAKPLRDSLADTERDMIEILDRSHEESPKWKGVRSVQLGDSPIERVTSLAQVFFNCTLILVTDSSAVA